MGSTVSAGSTGNAKAEQSRATREALVEAAVELFSEAGYRATSLKAIAKRAGVTHGVIPFHFGSKEGLLHAVVERCFDAYSSAVFGPLGDGPRDFGLGDLAAFVNAQLDFQAQNPSIGRLFQVLMFEALGPTPELAPHFRALHQRLHLLGCTWIRAGQERGTLRVDLDVEATADALLSFYAGVRTHSLLLGEPFDRASVHAAMLRLLDGGARPEPESPDP